MKKVLMMFAWFCLIFVFFAFTQVFDVNESMVLYIFLLLAFGLSFVLSMINLSRSMKSAVIFLLLGGLVILSFGALFELPHFFMITAAYFLALMIYLLLTIKK